jgi:hypothetical protein
MNKKNSITIAVAILFTAIIGCGEKKPAGLVASWSDGNANGGVDGQLINDVGFTSGKVGRAFMFDGQSNYVEVADRPSLSLTNALTIVFWAKRNASGLHIIVEKGGDWTSDQNSFAVDLNDTYAGGVFAFNYTGGWRGCSVNPDLDWHHYAVAVQNGQRDVILYMDGMPQTVSFRQGSSIVRVKPSALPLHIGAQIDPNFTYFSKTLIDGLAIYNRALSAGEIQALFNAGKH